MPSDSWNENLTNGILDKTQLDNGINIEDVQVGLQLTKLKLIINAGWLLDFYNHMGTIQRERSYRERMEGGGYLWCD